MKYIIIPIIALACILLMDWLAKKLCNAKMFSDDEVDRDNIRN